MRRIRYQVACSLDGFIAGPGDGTDWIVNEPEIDFKELFDQFDTLLMGRRTYEGMQGRSTGGFWGKRVLVFSRTLRPADHPEVSVVADDVERTLEELRVEPGKDIWLFGGGKLFHSLLEIGCVDTVELAVMPVLLGGGIPLLAGPSLERKLALTGQRVYPTGVVGLEYTVQQPEAPR